MKAVTPSPALASRGAWLDLPNGGLVSSGKRGQKHQGERKKWQQVPVLASNGKYKYTAPLDEHWNADKQQASFGALQSSGAGPQQQRKAQPWCPEQLAPGIAFCVYSQQPVFQRRPLP